MNPTYIYCVRVQATCDGDHKIAWQNRWFPSLTAAIAAIRKDPTSKRVNGTRPQFHVEQHIAALVDLDADVIIGCPTQHEIRASCAAPGKGEIRTRGDRRCFVEPFELHGTHFNVLAHKKHSSFATSFDSDYYGPYVRIWDVFHQEWSRYRWVEAVPPEVLASLSEAERAEIERRLPQSIPCC